MGRNGSVSPVVQAGEIGSASRDGSGAANRRPVMAINGLAHHQSAEPWLGRRQRQTFYLKQSPICSSVRYSSASRFLSPLQREPYGWIGGTSGNTIRTCKERPRSPTLGLCPLKVDWVISHSVLQMRMAVWPVRTQ